LFSMSLVIPSLIFVKLFSVSLVIPLHTFFFCSFVNGIFSPS
jgi:hypothetical protein